MNKRFLKTIHGIKIYLVDASIVRNKIKTDFTIGSNYLADRVIPRGQIWIDDKLKGLDRRAIIEHEVYEVGKMARGMPYAKAHRLATNIERIFRKTHSAVKRKRRVKSGMSLSFDWR